MQLFITILYKYCIENYSFKSFAKQCMLSIALIDLRNEMKSISKAKC